LTPDFTFRDGERVIRFGRGVVAEAAGLIEAQGLGGYALLSTERAMSRAPASLTAGAATVLHVPAGPVPEIAAAVRDEVHGRPLVAFGGGRVVDAAKAIAAADGLCVAAIPTTLAGSSYTPFHRMPAGVEGYGSTRPVLAVCDADLMASAPMPGLAATAMNALAHAVEALYAPGANPVSESAALRAAVLIASGLKDPEPVRSELAEAAVLAGYAVGVAGLCVHHAVCQTIVRVAETPHAATNAVMLPHTVAFMAGRAPREIEALAEALGSSGRDGVADTVARLSAKTMVTSLGQLGFEPARAGEVASTALHHPGVALTPGDVTLDDLRSLVGSAL